MSARAGLLCIGECMVELSGGENALYQQGFAGDTLNTAWHARAALPSGIPVGFFTAVGTDTMSDRMLDFLDRSQIARAHVLRIPERRPGLYMIEQRDGDRHFTYWRDTSAARLMAEDPERLTAAFAEAAYLYFSGITLAILTPQARDRLVQACLNAQQDGAKLVFDPNIRPALWPDAAQMRDVLETTAALCDIVLPSFDDEKTHFGDATAEQTCARFARLTKGRAEIIVRDGARPVHLLTPGGVPEAITVPTVAQIVDATGAGDAFSGSYLAARLSGQSPRNAALKGIATSAQVIGHHGAIPR
ncbi:2-keto-3-deoxygluconate kinase [Celeribacter baekdonensis]|uniref:2-keto-3-deoxygluconate kinase n=1 Tax=Celeribacter baekdonensis TaxID=875171 RepID=A0A1G7P4T8_9RHOB|nr:sugar kinase [Celeribacter baekdonensis]SDF81244.1 2-keto-3-deoxygluconate kinase [Celeribacter baekdonensis]